MSTTTTRVALYKPDATGIENINVVTDVNNNMDKIDSLIGFVICTSGTRPATPYAGEAIYETDTSKAYVCTSTGPAVWTQLLIGTAGFDSNISLPAVTQRVSIGGSGSSGSFTALRAAATDPSLTFGVTGDSVMRLFIGADGKLSWGPGNAVIDTNLYRNAANSLRTDDALSVGGALAVTGATSVDDLTIAGDLNIGSARFRNQLSSQATVANTTSEQALATMTIPANDAVVGAVYRLTAWGIASVTGTPTMTLRTRIGGVAGTQLGGLAIVCRSGMTDGKWRLTTYVAITQIGATGGWDPWWEIFHNFVNTASPFSIVMDRAGVATQATTSAQDLVVTGAWSAASASNTINCRGFMAERVA